MTPREMPARLGPKLRAIREYLGLTLDDMAIALGRSDTGRRARVLEWETGKRQPDLHSLLVYARLVNIPVDVLIDDEAVLRLMPEDRGLLT